MKSKGVIGVEVELTTNLLDLTIYFIYKHIIPLHSTSLHNGLKLEKLKTSLY